MMQREAIIEAFTKHANAVLSSDQPLDEAQLATWREHDAVLVDQMQRTFEAARNPDQFEVLRVSTADARFEQVYELLRTTFEPDVLSPYENWYRGFTRGENEGDLQFGRFWRVAGTHQYSTDGRLTQFTFDPINATESIASYCDGSYLVMEDGRAIVGIGYAVTRRGLRKGQGHGRKVVEAVEEAAWELAQKRGHKLEMILLESEARARPFWYRMGYRWPQDSVYFQPAMSIDRDTGEPVGEAVPELMMVKDMQNPDATTVDRERLIELVRFLYTCWFYQTCRNDAAQERHRGYIYDELFGQFEASLPDEAQVALVEPPWE